MNKEEYIHYLLERSFQQATKKAEEKDKQSALLVSNKWFGLLPFSLRILYKRKSNA